MSATQGCWSEPNVQGKLAELGPVSEDTTSLNATTTAQNITEPRKLFLFRDSTVRFLL